MGDNPIKPATPEEIELVELAVVTSFTTDVTTGYTDIIKRITQTDIETGKVHSVRNVRETVETPELPLGFWTAAVEESKAALSND